jgi:hypothetical protein
VLELAHALGCVLVDEDMPATVKDEPKEPDIAEVKLVELFTN